MLIHLFVSFILWRKHVRKQCNIQFFIFHLEETQIKKKSYIYCNQFTMLLKILAHFEFDHSKKLGQGNAKRFKSKWYLNETA